MDHAAMLALNNAHAAETSPLDHDALGRLLARASHVGVRDEGRAAFMIVLAESADYDNANFAWFKRRYPRFLYVDRVIVAPDARGRGLARALYGELFDLAVDNARSVIGCEVNLDPPNVASDALHAALGFTEVGRARLGSGKVVRYLTYET